MDPTEFRGEVPVRAPARMTGCGCGRAHGGHPNHERSEKVGGLEIAKDRQEENQEKHPWCPVEGRGGEQAGLLGQSLRIGVGGGGVGLRGTEFHRALPWEDFRVAEKWRGGLSRGCTKP